MPSKVKSWSLYLRDDDLTLEGVDLNLGWS